VMSGGLMSTNSRRLMAPPGQSRTSSDTSHRPIHILSVIDDLPFGGDEYRLLAFAQSLDKNRFQHSVVTLMREDQEIAERYGSMRERYRRAGVRLLDLAQPPIADKPRTGFPRLRSFKDRVWDLKSLFRKTRIDVLDVHLAPTNPTCAAAALGTGIPFVVTLYQLDTKQSRQAWLAGQFNLGSASLLITDSKAQAFQIRKRLVRSREIRVIPNGTPVPQPVLTREQMLRVLDIPLRPAVTIIGQISSLVSYKGHSVLLEAAKQVIEQHSDCFFLLVGYERAERGRRECLLQQASELGIRERVRILGYPGPIGDVWNVIDIHVHASLLDSLPNALLEAMSLGKPSVATSVGGVPEAIEHGVNGFLVPPANPDELARHLLLLLEDAALRTELGRGAHATYCRRYLPRDMTKQLEDCFSAITAR
jgi:glycosyltransferase involved in cell wall biosynthesis